MNQGKKMAEIQASWCQNGDINKGVKIKQVITLHITESYMMAVFLCQRMFNPMTAFYANRFKTP